MSLEDRLFRLENDVLRAARVRGFTDAVDEIRKMLAREDTGVRAAILKLVAPSIGKDLAAACAAAFNLGIRDALSLVDAPPKTSALPDGPDKATIAAAKAVEKAIADEMRKARKLAHTGADAQTIMAPVSAAVNHLERGVTSLVVQAGNAGATAVADAAGVPTVWVAETNACVTCLAYSGEVAAPGKPFRAGRTYGRRSTVTEPIYHPPAHPHCRCHVEPLNDTSYAEALRREADRSVLRGFSLESESMATRIDAAQRLVERGVDAPKTVIAYARRAIKAGEFPTRGRP